MQAIDCEVLRLQAQLMAKTACPRCGKATLIRTLVPTNDPEPVTAATHCTCPGGPAAGLTTTTTKTEDPRDAA